MDIPQFIRGIQDLIQENNSGTIKIRIEIMKDSKKEDYWGTSIRKFLTDGETRFDEEGIIYINTRDAGDRNKIIQIILHELEHLIDDKENLNTLYNNIDKFYLKNKEV